MKRLLIAVLAVCAFAAVSAQSAAASVGWPASCTRIACVNSHLNNLDQRQRSTSLRISSLQSQVADLQNQVSTLQSRLQNTNAKLACIVGRTLWQNYSYDYYGSYFQFLNLNHSYVGGGGNVDGPFTALFESASTDCQGTF